ncbi:MAG: nucleoside hydrolase-like domain-containing protein [Prolixibacteraceae bacterium]
MKIKLIILFLLAASSACSNKNTKVGNSTNSENKTKPRVIVLSDAEIDDQCSMVRFLLYSNEWDVEGIISTSSQYHWQGHRWAGDDWLDPYLEAYSDVYPNLILHDKAYPTPEYLKSIAVHGNLASEGEMDSITAGSQLIVKVFLDDTRDQPIWIQAWGGINTLARALKTIEEEHPEKMERVANKLRFFFIWEQDSTYQAYIRPHWGKFNIPTIICDQFWAIAYQWDKIMPDEKTEYFTSDWMKANILEDHGALCSLYQAYKGGDDNEGWKAGNSKQQGDFRSEGDSPAFIHAINTGLRNMESPDFGGWGGRYVNVRENTWLDPVPEPNYTYPEGRWYTASAWGRNYMRTIYPENKDLMNTYFKPITRWADVLQNDFASRADWCVKSYENANHPPLVQLKNALDISAKPGNEIQLSAQGTLDPDGDELSYSWWQYSEAGTYAGSVEIVDSGSLNASFKIPNNARKGETIHLVCEVKDNGTPQLTRYQRVILTIK